MTDKLVEKCLLTLEEMELAKIPTLEKYAHLPLREMKLEGIFQLEIQTAIASAATTKAIPLIAEEIKRELEKKLTVRNEVDITDKKVKPHYKMHIAVDLWHTFWERY